MTLGLGHWPSELGIFWENSPSDTLANSQFILLWSAWPILAMFDFVSVNYLRTWSGASIISAVCPNELLLMTLCLAHIWSTSFSNPTLDSLHARAFWPERGVYSYFGVESGRWDSSIQVGHQYVLKEEEEMGKPISPFSTLSNPGY